MDSFKEIHHLIYFVKQLKDIDKDYIIGDLNNEPLLYNGEINYDVLHEAATRAVYEELFENTKYRYYENHELELVTLSDKVLVDFYQLAGEFGKKNGLSEESNPYLKDAEREVRGWFNFSYSLDWLIKGYTDPKKAHRSRLALFLYHNDYVDILGVAIGIAGMYEYYSYKCAELHKLLSSDTEQKDTGKEVIVA